MTGAISPLALTVTGLFVLVGFAFTGLLVSRAQAVEKRLATRRDHILQPHTRVQTIDIRLFGQAKTTQVPIQFRVASLFGVDLERSDITPVPWWVIVIGTGMLSEVAASALSSIFGILAWVAFPVGWVGGSRMVFGSYLGKRRTKLLGQFPDALMMIVRAVRVGVPVGEAIFIVAKEQPEPTASEFKLLANQLSIGEPMDKAMAVMAKHAGLPEYRFFATALTLQSKAGGALSGTLEGLADLIRRRVAVKERAHALASEARMSIYVLTGLPVLVAGGMALLNPAYISLLITDHTGNKILTAAIMMLLTGLGIMQLIVKKSVS